MKNSGRVRAKKGNKRVLGEMESDSVSFIFFTGNGTYRFRISCVAGVQYVDLLQRLVSLAFPGHKGLLGFGEGAGKVIRKGRGKAKKGKMEVTTKLWDHQQQTVEKVAGAFDFIFQNFDLFLMSFPFPDFRWSFKRNGRVCGCFYCWSR